MAINYDPITNRMRTFRFSHNNNLETLKRERPEDVLDIEEYGRYYRTRQDTRTSKLLLLAFFTGSGIYFYRDAQFKALHPFIRATAIVGLPITYYIAYNTKCKNIVQETLDSLLITKTKDQFEDPSIVKHRELTA